MASGSLPAPDHEYPSSLTLVLTATDSAGISASTSLRLDPRTVDLTFATNPTGLGLTVGAAAVTAPVTRTGHRRVVEQRERTPAGRRRHALRLRGRGRTVARRPTTSSRPPRPGRTRRRSQPLKWAALRPRVTTTPSRRRRGRPRRRRCPEGGSGSAPWGPTGGPTWPPPTSRVIPSRWARCSASAASPPTPRRWRPARRSRHCSSAAGDNSIWQRTVTSGSQGAWAALPIGGATTDGPSAVVTSGDVVHLVVRGTNGGVFHATRRGTTWSPWENLGGVINGTPAVAVDPGGGIAVVVRGTDDGIWVQHGDTGAWTGWAPLGGRTFSSPTVAWASRRGISSCSWLGPWEGSTRATSRVVGGAAGTSSTPRCRRAARLAAAATSGRVIVYASAGGTTTYRQYTDRWVGYNPAPYTCVTCVPSARAARTVP